jgi:hypothetical protein
MKKTLITAGAVVAALSFCQAPLFAAEQQPSSSLRYGSSTAEMHTFEGRLMPLYDYLAKGASGVGAAASSLDRAASSLARPQADRPDADSTTDRALSTDPSSNPSQNRLGAGQPGQSGAAGFGSGVTAGSFGGAQPLVLIADSALGQKSGQESGTPSATTTTPSIINPLDQGNQNQGARSTQTTPGSRVLGAAGQQAYLLVFNPHDASGRMALNKAQSMIDSSGSGSAPSAIRPGTDPARGDRLPVRDEATDNDNDPTRPNQERDQQDQLRAQVQQAQPGRQSQDQWSREDASRAHGALTGGMAHGKVKVTGRVLSREGIQAIEVSSIEAADSTQPGASGLNRETRSPFSTQPDAQPIQPGTRPPGQPQND